MFAAYLKQCDHPQRAALLLEEAGDRRMACAQWVNTGYGLIEVTVAEMTALGHGTIKNAPGLLPSRCLVRIGDTLANLIQQHQPDVMVVEGLVYVQNTRIGFTLDTVGIVFQRVCDWSSVPAICVTGCDIPSRVG